MFPRVLVVLVLLTGNFTALLGNSNWKEPWEFNRSWIACILVRCDVRLTLIRQTKTSRRLNDLCAMLWPQTLLTTTKTLWRTANHGRMINFPVERVNSKKSMFLFPNYFLFLSVFENNHSKVQHYLTASLPYLAFSIRFYYSKTQSPCSSMIFKDSQLSRKTLMWRTDVSMVRIEALT